MIPDPRYLIPGSGAAACASLLPRIQRTGIRHQSLPGEGRGIRTDADPPPASSERPGLGRDLIPDS